MIITRSPLRITLGGGGTDLPSYYEEHEGFLVAAAINKYVYVTVHETFQAELILKYSRIERPASAREVEHPIIREALASLNMEKPHIEIISMADIPAGTGLGSSGAFTTALLMALHTYKKDLIHPDALAAEACRIEIERLREPIGKQDQYIAAFGGMTCFRFKRDGSVEAWPLAISEETHHALEDGLLLYYTGESRAASDILETQHRKTLDQDASMIANLHHVKALGLQSKDALESGDLRRFGALMHEHWDYTRGRAAAMSSDAVDAAYTLARENGAIGGKLIGAGGGGFLMFYTEDKRRLRAAMKHTGLREVRIALGVAGTRVVS